MSGIKMIGINICNAMIEQGVTVSELARRTRYDRGNLRQKIYAPEKMKIDMLVKIANALGVDWRDLWEGVL